MQFKGKSSEVVTDHKLNKTQKCPAGTKKGSTILGCRNRETARHLEQPFALHLALRKLHVGPCPYLSIFKACVAEVEAWQRQALGQIRGLENVASE